MQSSGTDTWTGLQSTQTPSFTSSCSVDIAHHEFSQCLSQCLVELRKESIPAHKKSLLMEKKLLWLGKMLFYILYKNHIWLRVP